MQHKKLSIGKRTIASLVVVASFCCCTACSNSIRSQEASSGRTSSTSWIQPQRTEAEKEKPIKNRVQKFNRAINKLNIDDMLMYMDPSDSDAIKTFLAIFEESTQIDAQRVLDTTQAVIYLLDYIMDDSAEWQAFHQAADIATVLKKLTIKVNSVDFSNDDKTATVDCTFSVIYDRQTYSDSITLPMIYLQDEWYLDFLPDGASSFSDWFAAQE